MLFIIDFDGTVAPTDTVDALLETFADPKWRLIEDEWTSGRLNSRECMKAQLALVRVDRVALENFFRSIVIDPYFPAFVKHVSAHAEIAVVSDGIDYPIHLALRKIGLSSIGIYANHLEFPADGLDISFPFSDESCAQQSGVCKCAVMRNLSDRAGEPSILIGDGRSDYCVARAVNYVFAKGSLREYCDNNGIAHSSIDSFHEVLSEVQKWDSARFNRQNEKDHAIQ
jgi:2-hydroxy-3-keto-5-methylthiopentenyl-1-phosphate phosphatase